MQLINSTTKQPVQIGDQVTTRDGYKVEVITVTKPHKPGSTGRMYVKGSMMSGEFFPGVFNCEWTEEVTA